MIKKTLSACLLLAISIPVGLALAGDPVAGQEKAATCAACHGENGIPTIVTYPILAGQYPSYIEHSLQGYRNGARENAIMAGFAAALSDEDISDLAAWFSSLPGPLQTAPRP